MVSAEDIELQFYRMASADKAEDEADEFAHFSSADKVMAGKIALAAALLEAKADVNSTDKVCRFAIGPKDVAVIRMQGANKMCLSDGMQRRLSTSLCF